MRVGIIGAGIAGLTLGTQLVEAGHSVLLLDKGRGGVGGRASSRIGDGIAFDHGCHYFTVRGEPFRKFLDDHVPERDRAVWNGRFATLNRNSLVPETPDHPRFVGVPGMKAIALAIAVGLEIREATRVIRLTGSPGRWGLVDLLRREEGPFDWVVSTAPPIQTTELFVGQSPIAGATARVVMEPCFALMIEPSNGATLPFDLIRCRHPVLGWAVNNHSKPGREPKPALIIQSNHHWAQAHVYDELPAVGRALREAVREAIGVDLGPIVRESVHRWLFAKAIEPLGLPCLVDPSNRLASCGDWCVEPRIEGAFLSGQACAAAILSQSTG